MVSRPGGKKAPLRSPADTRVAPPATARFTCSSSRSAAATDDSGAMPSAAASTLFVNLSRNSSYTSEATMNRFAALQAWPVFSKRPPTAASTVASRSSELSTMNGSDPPSSSTTFFRLRPATSATAAPARSDPVSETACTRGSAMILATCSLVA